MSIEFVINIVSAIVVTCSTVAIAVFTWFIYKINERELEIKDSVNIALRTTNSDGANYYLGVLNLSKTPVYIEKIDYIFVVEHCHNGTKEVPYCEDLTNNLFLLSPEEEISLLQISNFESNIRSHLDAIPVLIRPNSNTSDGLQVKEGVVAIKNFGVFVITPDGRRFCSRTENLKVTNHNRTVELSSFPKTEIQR